MLVKMNKLKKDVCQDLSPRKPMFEKHFNRDISAAGPSTALPTFNNKKDSLYNIRKKYLQSEKLTFNTLDSVFVPEGLRKNFLVTEDGTTEKILVFMTTLAKKMFRKARQHFGDGTFKCVPRPFYQLFSIHIDLHSDRNTTNVIPVLYALLPNKSQSTYIRLFEIIKSYGIKLKKFKCDYEVAVMNAVKAVYPQCVVSGSYFHYQKAVWEKAKDLNVTTTSEERQIVRMANLLPLLPAANIPEGRQIILSKIEVSLEIISRNNGTE